MADYHFTSIAKHIHSHLEFTFPLPLSYSLFLLVALKNNKKKKNTLLIFQDKHNGEATNRSTVRGGTLDQTGGLSLTSQSGSPNHK